MQRRVNVYIPFACPQCDVEMVVTLEELHAGATVRCVSCGTRVALKPEDLSLAHHASGSSDMPTQFQV